MKKIRCLLPLLLLALFTGCTLMIDEPETATTPQETENGDGITSPRRLVSDMGECLCFLSYLYPDRGARRNFRHETQKELKKFVPYTKKS